MGMLNFFTNVANTFLNHYRQLAESMQYRPTRRLDLPSQTTTPEKAQPSDSYQPSTAVADPEQTAQTSQPQDALLLSGQQPPSAGTTKTASTDPNATKDEAAEPANDNDADDQSTAPAATNPDGTYYLRRAARLDYTLNLQFNLAAVQRTVQSISEGDTRTVEQLSAAGFGLSAAFDLRGIQSIETNMTDGSQSNGAVRSRSALGSRQANAFAANSRNFALQGFRRDTTKIMQANQQINKDGYQKAVNRFAVRYRMDSKFSFSFLQRFNTQTAQVADQQPGAVNQYVDTAGKVAEQGSTDMMAAFFDGVDAYLNNAEKSLIDKTVSSFEQAAKELGFSGATVDALKSHLTDSIEGFFDRVDTALAGMRSQFAPASQPVTQPDTPVVQPPTDVVNPTVDPSKAVDTEQMVQA